MKALESCGYRISCWLSRPRPWHRPESVTVGEVWCCLLPGDVLLVEGSSRLSTVIKYLTQSSWSHAALFVGSEAAIGAGGAPGSAFVEADLAEGVRLVGYDEFSGYPLRICRPVGLADNDIQQLIEHATHRVGQRYDLRNIFDLARYLMPLPPVPVPWRRGMLALGSGDPTRAICSTLLAEAFQFINYPILPIEEWLRDEQRCAECRRRIFRRRHFSLFTPRDFDLSPYFQIIKPGLGSGFDPHRLRWASSEGEGEVV
ncbi:lipo-like protein [Halomonas sp. KAO]|uniref:YiiX/YebB-like N1pC/P60 family cysteine hydrolase n=1 Tax=unclassified Halomonas TaxID=2609666 RepID=UPI00189D4FBD|nr:MULTISPECIES: YiiX/YebB-like N1pC/P60 family cysteine hydrolase [unclassified Halomonas]MBF7053029.1 lipo-like protein [Halomonas sp. KAO]MDT0513138.1 YiiX/YebB-like N1pC/P60 family cysteine hydrolase [Halomonas sp. LES1]MDT0591451.1 YiiX/YebB-like N1pC/P60 family cysteine hydrolase [Halomonas sp. PAR8]